MSDGKLPVDNARAFMQNALSMLSSSSQTSVATSASAAASKASEKSPDDIPKEELVHLCMKMNKRMQNMELKGQELIKKKNSLTSDRKVLIDFLKSIPLHVHFTDDQDVSSDILNESWKQFLANQNEYVSSLEAKLATAEFTISQNESRYRQDIHQLQATLNQSNSSGSSDNDSNDATGSVTYYQNEISRMLEEVKRSESAANELKSKVRKLELDIDSKRAIENNLKGNVGALENSISSKDQMMNDLRKQLDSTKSQFEEKLLFLQMQQNNSKSKEDSLLKENSELKKVMETQHQQISSIHLKIEERDISLLSMKEVNQALQTKLIETETLLTSTREHLKDVERTARTSVDGAKERDDVILSLHKELKSSQEYMEESTRRIKELEEYRIKTEGLMMKLATQADHINQLTISLEDSTSLITRLRTEAHANDRNHAMRTAMLATCEAQLEAMKTELTSKNDGLKETTERVTSLQSRLASAELRFEERMKEANSKVYELETKLSTDRKSHDDAITDVRNQYENNIDEMKKEFAKKSNLARSLITEKEEENRLLLSKIQELQSEISSGAPSERRIFELAQSQARRENFHGQHSDTREIAFSKVQTALAEKDMELALLQQRCSETSLEIAELKRVTRRETVNMDYLKNITLQYMTFPINAPERLSLIPVIATLLQFNPKELIEVEKSSKDPAWSSRPVKEIKKSLNRAAGMSTSQHGMPGHLEGGEVASPAAASN